ncbi:hypothetical protein ATO10_08838 [Actibacterium atlanticum]|uniref:HEPN AbiU2-like domain-containing protein n=2 Tax=Actibacterium atlanticum TaxID=1461693 RepID=A0A058ZJZ7_9RHOB|nr:hypothetical protein ATO10_08838 [Actibacterium atlanticum]
MHLYELSIPKADIEKLDETEWAFIATLAFAMDEISVFQKLLVHAKAQKPEAEELRIAHAIQENTITRALCAKIFEAVKLFDQYQRLADRNGLSDVRNKLVEFSESFDELKADPIYSLAKDIRDHATNHYLPSETKKNLEHVSDKAITKAFLHRNIGNSFYPLGEEFVFLGRIGRHYAEEYDRPHTMEDVRKWVEWALAASKVLTHFFTDYLVWVQRERFPEWALKPTKPYLEPELYGELGETPLKLFFEASRLKKPSG